MAESDGQEVKKPLTVANDETKRWRGGKGTQQRMDERMNYAYATMLEGGTRRQVLQKVMDRFGVSEVTASRDYTAAMALLKTEQIETRDNLLNFNINNIVLTWARYSVKDDASWFKESKSSDIFS